MIGEDGALTDSERQTFALNRDSEFFRIARKAIGQQWRYTASRLTKATPDTLQREQGVLAGLEAAYNVLGMVAATELPKTKSD